MAGFDKPPQNHKIRYQYNINTKQRLKILVILQEVFLEARTYIYSMRMRYPLTLKWKTKIVTKSQLLMPFNMSFHFCDQVLQNISTVVSHKQFSSLVMVSWGCFRPKFFVDFPDHVRSQQTLFWFPFSRNSILNFKELKPSSCFWKRVILLLNMLSVVLAFEIIKHIF